MSTLRYFIVYMSYEYTKVSCLVATLLTVSSHEPEAVILPRFNIIWQLNSITESLYSEIQSHLQAQVTSPAVLVEYVQTQLFRGENSSSSAGNNTSTSSGSGGTGTTGRRPKELDNARVCRAVETAVLVEQLMFESR
jgi:hypothetical protein